jgi:hypothetical protein
LDFSFASPNNSLNRYNRLILGEETVQSDLLGFGYHQPKRALNKVNKNATGAEV